MNQTQVDQEATSLPVSSSSFRGRAWDSLGNELEMKVAFVKFESTCVFIDVF